MRDKTKELVEEIKSLIDEGYTNTEIARLLFKHPAYIGRLARQNGFDCNLRRHTSEKPVSNMHLKLGKILLERRVYELRKSLSEMAKYTKISSTRMANIEGGVCNITLIEFLEICKYYELDPREMLQRIS